MLPAFIMNSEIYVIDFQFYVKKYHFLVKFYTHGSVWVFIMFLDVTNYLDNYDLELIFLLGIFVRTYFRGWREKESECGAS